MVARSRMICGFINAIRSANDGDASAAVSSKFSTLNVAIRSTVMAASNP